MLNKEIRKFIIEPTLAKAGWSTPADSILIYGTGMIETGFQAIMQIGTPKNGGIGFYQEEPSDFKDVCIWLRNGFNRNIYDRILSICNYTILPTDIMFVAHNIAFATLICRIHYHRVKQPLPDAQNAQALAQYHMIHYNGNGEGKTNVDKNTELFQRIISGNE